MPTLDPRIDANIERSAPFAQPILIHLRKLIHKACPDVVETLKWSMPFFEYKGPLCNMAAFKQHCAFGFWKQKLIDHSFPKSEDAMSSFGRITAIKDLPSDKILTALIKEAAKLNEAGVKLERKPKADRGEIIVPTMLSDALKKNAAAKKTFDNFPPSKKRDYVEWIEDAKTDATREKRLATTIEQLAEGKSKNWKYETKKK
jgi:uncharacterized protein YdeI (YjbR/CyaY-like superfamily)